MFPFCRQKKSQPKSLIANRLSLIAIFCSAAILSLPAIASAYKVELPLPNMPTGIDIVNPGQYIQYFFVFSLYFLAVLATVTIAFGGLAYVLAAGNPTKIGKAKEIIIGALSGLVLLLCSYIILNTIDPELTRLSPGELPEVKSD